ncbi:5'-nucleotidase [Desulfofundulus luciae]|uniref:5'-nucleotidase SurE n=1 Tax=Desulfofundulus luciae TaxID=74702 RepID=A0ABU0B4K7_9FIRM|nr:5'/3'-nucleotidase SurE [Desulfofundulus luciae]MDQ0287652.1 5'-nucleotidase [Desulfofundulus luciae]
MIVLLSNDDGIHAPGLKALAESLQELGELYIVAPDRERSATGHGITVHRPLRLETVSIPGIKARAWAVDGTPADCVKLAVEDLLPDPPALVVAGINQGPNLGTDVLYSGTVSAAIEGIINGFPALAISLTSYGSHDFTTAAEVARKVVNLTMQKGLPRGTLLNINVPPAKPRGIRFTRLGNRRYVNIFHKRTDPRGRIYYWMAGEPLDLDENGDDTDVQAIKQNFISITPIQLDLTDYQSLQTLRQQWGEVIFNF